MAPGEGPCLPSPCPVPSCHLPPLLLSLRPEGPRRRQVLGCGWRAARWTGAPEMESEPPHQRQSQSLWLQEPQPGPANIPGLQAQLSLIPAWDFGKHWQQTPPHLRRSSDLLEPGQRGLPQTISSWQQASPANARKRKGNTFQLRACLRFLKGLRHWLLAPGSL